MARRSTALGRRGEKLAESFLSQKGYQVLERNYRGGRGEIDLICKDGDALIFVEVKARSSSDFGPPEEAINEAKRRQLIKLAKRYLVRKNLWGKVDCRFDVVAIDSEKNIRHIQNAFRA